MKTAFLLVLLFGLCFGQTNYNPNCAVTCPLYPNYQYQSNGGNPHNYLGNLKPTNDKGIMQADVFKPDGSLYSKKLLLNYETQTVDTTNADQSISLANGGKIQTEYNCQLIVSGYYNTMNWTLNKNGVQVFNINGISGTPSITKSFCWVSDKYNMAYIAVGTYGTSYSYYSAGNVQIYSSSLASPYSQNKGSVTWPTYFFCNNDKGVVYDQDSLVQLQNHKCCNGICDSYYTYNQNGVNFVKTIPQSFLDTRAGVIAGFSSDSYSGYSIFRYYNYKLTYTTEQFSSITYTDIPGNEPTFIAPMIALVVITVVISIIVIVVLVYRHKRNSVRS